jgi:hypothetical protein
MTTSPRINPAVPARVDTGKAKFGAHASANSLGKKDFAEILQRVRQAGAYPVCDPVPALCEPELYPPAPLFDGARQSEENEQLSDFQGSGETDNAETQNNPGALAQWSGERDGQQSEDRRRWLATTIQKLEDAGLLDVELKKQGWQGSIQVGHIGGATVTIEMTRTGNVLAVCLKAGPHCDSAQLSLYATDLRIWCEQKNRRDIEIHAQIE